MESLGEDRYLQRDWDDVPIHQADPSRFIRAEPQTLHDRIDSKSEKPKRIGCQEPEGTVYKIWRILIWYPRDLKISRNRI